MIELFEIIKKKHPERTVAKTDDKIRIGWREWVALPALEIPALKAKIDTGARTSALHAFAVDPFEADGHLKVRFGIHPLRKRTDIEIFCVADVIDRRIVSDSGGNREWRYVIRTPIRLGELEWDIEINLTNRNSMLFRLLLGRTATRGRFFVDPEASYLTGRSLGRSYLRALKKESMRSR